MDKDLADQVVDIATRVVAGGAISANGHGNVSVRVPGADEMYFTAGPSLRDHPASAVVRVGLDGTLREGDCRRSRAPWSPCTPRCTPTTRMSAASCTPTRRTPRRTPSRSGRSAAGSRRWPCSACRTGCRSPAYGPRGSDEAIANIRAAVLPGVPAVLLANHGVLVFHRTPELAIMIGGVVEEAAQASINAAPSAARSRFRRRCGRRRCSARWRSIARGRFGRRHGHHSRHHDEPGQAGTADRVAARSALGYAGGGGGRGWPRPAGSGSTTRAERSESSSWW